MGDSIQYSLSITRTIRSSSAQSSNCAVLGRGLPLVLHVGCASAALLRRRMLAPRPRKAPLPLGRRQQRPEHRVKPHTSMQHSSAFSHSMPLAGCRAKLLTGMLLLIPADATRTTSSVFGSWQLDARHVPRGASIKAKYWNAAECFARRFERRTSRRRTCLCVLAAGGVQRFSPNPNRLRHRR